MTMMHTRWEPVTAAEAARLLSTIRGTALEPQLARLVAAHGPLVCLPASAAEQGRYWLVVDRGHVALIWGPRHFVPAAVL